MYKCPKSFLPEETWGILLSIMVYHLVLYRYLLHKEWYLLVEGFKGIAKPEFVQAWVKQGGVHPTQLVTFNVDDPHTPAEFVVRCYRGDGWPAALTPAGAAISALYLYTVQEQLTQPLVIRQRGEKESYQVQVGSRWAEMGRKVRVWQTKEWVDYLVEAAEIYYGLKQPK